MKKGKFNERMVNRILKLAKEGKTTEEIAECVGISDRIIYIWMGKHEGFAEALKESREMADEIVEASLFQRAVGYSHKETKVFFHQESATPVEHTITKNYPPDTSAAIMWLTNRDPDRWADKKKITHEGTIETISDEELDRKIAEKLKAVSK